MQKMLQQLPTDLTFTMFQPGLKSGGAGVDEKYGRGTVYELLVVAAAAL